MIGLSEDIEAALAIAAAAAASAFIITTIGDRNRFFWRAIITGLCLCLMWRYMAWRLTETLPPLDISADAFVGLLFAGVEALSLVGSTLSLLFLTRTIDRTPEVEHYKSWLRAHPKQPRVDVLICTYNEDETILERTIVGALWTTYLNVRIWVCDDGRRPWLAELAEKYACGYITRPDNKHAKAGNINNALRHLASLDEKPDYVAILDADFVPAPEFLQRTLTLFHDEAVGLVQTPQHFSNPDPIQTNLAISHAWPDEQRYFFDVIMPSKDAWGAAFCCGTSSVIRFGPLMEIGGFPTTSVTEDYLVSLKLRQRGYQTVYLNERLSLGLAPEGLKEYVTQRGRWCLGFVQICRSPDGPWWPGNGLRLADRLILTETFLYWSVQHLFRILCLLVPSLYLAFGIVAVEATLADALLYFLPYFTVMLVCMSWLTQRRVLPILTDVSQLLALHAILKAVAVGLIRPKNQKFNVTAKGGDRTRRIIQWPVLKFFLGYLGLALLGIALSFLSENDRGSNAASSLALFWTWYNIIVLAIASMVCIEQPRYRKVERFRVLSRMGLEAGDKIEDRFMIDASAGGFCFAGRAPTPIGSNVHVHFHGARYPGRIVRILGTQFSIAVDDRPEIRQNLKRTLFSEGYGQISSAALIHDVGSAIVTRVFR